MKIPFSKPFLTGKETHYIHQAVQLGMISGNGMFTKKCHQYFQERYGFNKCLLTTSCTDALEMAAILIDIKAGDEVIVPSYTFVSTANAFVLRGAKIVFADSGSHHPNLDADRIESLVTPRTKAIVAVHYAGVACDMDKILAIANKHGLYMIEDAAQSIDSFYKGKPLGSLGHLAAFSFHETKNVISGEGGMLVVNDDKFSKRAEILWEKGTNRAAFFRGEIDRYQWVDIGSSFLPSDIIAAFLYAQLEFIDDIQKKRKSLWLAYYELLKPLEAKGWISLPYIPGDSTNNAHMFYVIFKNINIRTQVVEYLKKQNIYAVSHYLSLHKSPFYFNEHDGRVLANADRYSDCLLRLPMYYELDEKNITDISAQLREVLSSCIP